MKEIIINVPEDAVEFVEEFVERIGGSVVEEKVKKKAKPKATKQKEKPGFKPLDFFGTWPDIPLDPKTYRKKLWRQTPEL